ncbi:class I SAM-dependent methyltransferase [Thioalkalivibrio sulfidiphilus]|nr:class I SAM-dependent methyltransferase [Thioalkalivibrio sulfidiphilus]
MMRELSCPLCTAIAPWYTADQYRDFFRCPACDLLFVDPVTHPSPDEERAIYDLHENDPDDPGYRRFLSRLTGPLIERLEPGMSGLDFGCGPGPALSMMLVESGFEVALYDPLYAPDARVLERRYDFVTCTEVVEHFHEPARDWPRLVQLLRPGGWLAVMTRMRVSLEKFPGWQYKNDPTHVCFYSPAVIQWLARRLGLELHLHAGDVVLFRRPVSK